MKINLRPGSARKRFLSKCLRLVTGHGALTDEILGDSRVYILRAA
jgi:hypothetical protein